MRAFDLVAFDVDGTLVTHSDRKTVWEVLNRRFTGDDTVNEERHRRVREGRMSYEEWVSLDIQGWFDAGADRDALTAAIREELQTVGGVRETVETLRNLGIRVVVLSGTLDLVLSTLLADVRFDEVYANRIGFDDRGAIAGWTATPFDLEGKAVALQAIAARESIALARCAFVGDSRNDLAVARIAGFTVAFNPKCAELAAVADAVVEGPDLRAVLPCLLDGARPGR